MQLDVTDHDSIEAAIKHDRARGRSDRHPGQQLRRLDAQRLTEVTPVDFDFMFDTNVKGAFFVAQAVAKQMIARSKQAAGLARPHRQYRVGCRLARDAADIGVYCMSKAAVIQMTRRRRSSGDATASTSTRSAPDTSAPKSTTPVGTPSVARKLLSCCRARESACPKTWTACCCCWWPTSRSSSTARSCPPTTGFR